VLVTRRHGLLLVLLLTTTLLLSQSYDGRSRAARLLSWDACPGLRLNEFLPEPEKIDWDRDGTVSPLDEWIELYNAAATPCNLNGWMLDDRDGPGSSPPHVIPPDTWLAPSGFLVFFRWQTGIALDKTTDQVRLLRPDGSLADAYTYYYTTPDGSWSRTADGSSWVSTYPPTPGWANGVPRRLYLPLVIAHQ
jgi:hypothetical protein